MNGDEMRQLEYMMVMDGELKKHPEALKKRLAGVPNGWRQLRLINRILGDLTVRILDTMDVKNLRHLEQVCRHGEVLIRINPASRLPEQMMVWEDDIRLVINRAMEADCAVCLKSPAEIRGCKLRKALDHMTPAYADAPSGHCPYRDVAGGCDLGEYV